LPSCSRTPATLGIFDPKHRGDRPHRPRRRGDAVLRRARNLNARHGLLATRRHGLRHPSTSTSTRRSRKPHGGGGPGRRPDRRELTASSPFLPRPQVVRREAPPNGGPPTFDLDEEPPRSRSGNCAVSRAINGVFRGGPGPTSCRSAAMGLQDVSEGRRAQRELPSSRGCARGAFGEHLPLGVRRALHARVSVLSGAADEEGARDPHARPRQSACSITACTRRTVYFPARRGRKRC